jgi:hypothetical protein
MTTATLITWLAAATFRRWITVYRESTVTLSVGASLEPGEVPVLRVTPAESNFPLAVVVGHGVFAVATVVGVLVTVLSAVH